jgi:hypothetical protein
MMTKGGIDAITLSQVHDARLVAAMDAHGIVNLLTLNAKDFRRFSSISVLSSEDVLASLSYRLVIAAVRPGSLWCEFIQKRGGVRIRVFATHKTLTYLESIQMTPWGQPKTYIPSLPPPPHSTFV